MINAEIVIEPRGTRGRAALSAIVAEGSAGATGAPRGCDKMFEMNPADKCRTESQQFCSKSLENISCREGAVEHCSAFPQ